MSEKAITLNPLVMDPHLLNKLYETCELALGYYGDDLQQTKCIEEMAELTVALCKGYDRMKTIDEIADAHIMTVQMILMYGTSEVGDRIKFKLERLRNQIQMEQNETKN